MTKMTKKNSLIKQLEQVGCFKSQGSSTKYVIFNHTKLSSNIYIGKNGALRYGKTIAKSRKMGKAFINALQKEFGFERKI